MKKTLLLILMLVSGYWAYSQDIQYETKMDIHYYSDSVNHYNMLRTIEKMYDLPQSGSAQANEITQVWN